MSGLLEWYAPSLLTAAAVLISACGGGGGNEPPPMNMTSAVRASGGDGQNGRVGAVLLTPLQVVVSEAGQPSPDVTVAWSTAAAAGALTPTSAATDANGVASSSWMLGTVAGAQTAQAIVAGASGSPVTFSATAAPGPANALSKAAGDQQTGETGTALEAPVQARVTDEFGNAVPDVGVNWSASGATVSAPSVPTDGSGISQVTVTVGATAGPISIVAASEGLVGSPLSFTATAVAPEPAPGSIAITVGNDFFRSNRNQTANPAVDTVAVGGTVTWTWTNTAASHNVTSSPPPSFTSSPTRVGPATHQVTFTAAGTYRYYCTLHAIAGSPVGMVGRIVVK